MNSPEIQMMRAQGAEVWSDLHMKATYSGVKTLNPNSNFKNMRDLYGKFKGETVFICGAGPSINGCPSTLPGPTFAINRAIKQVKADYWCFTDIKATFDSGDHPNTKTAIWAFAASMHVTLKDSTGYLIEADSAPMDHHIEEKRPLYWSGATFSWVLHWAVKSGAKRIVIIGCEFSLDGYFDGTPILPTGPASARVVSETARLRIDEMFGLDKPQWFDPNVEILDASGGYLPVPKTRLEEWL
jgi:predicted metallopeptidase